MMLESRAHWVETEKLPPPRHGSVGRQSDDSKCPQFEPRLTATAGLGKRKQPRGRDQVIDLCDLLFAADTTDSAGQKAQACFSASIAREVSYA